MSRECTSITAAHCFQEPRTDCHARDSCRLPLVHLCAGVLIRAFTPTVLLAARSPGRGRALLAFFRLPACIIVTRARMSTATPPQPDTQPPKCVAIHTIGTDQHRAHN